jgi:hypothetical protein
MSMLDDRTLHLIEKRLQTALPAHQPDPSFIAGLKQRLIAIPSVSIDKKETIQSALIWTIAIIGGTAIVLWAGNNLSRLIKSR